jgi:hypothetical protein
MTNTQQIERRQNLERRILRQVIADALRLGYVLTVHDGEEVTLRRSADAAAVMAALMTTDEDYLHLHKFDASGAQAEHGWVRLVYGNDGWDVICDYSVNIEAAVAGASALAEKLEGAR